MNSFYNRLTELQSESRYIRLSSRLQNAEYLLPQLARLPKMICEPHILHPGRIVTRQVLQRGNDVFETQGFPDGLRGASFEHDVHDVDVKVVICRLV